MNLNKIVFSAPTPSYNRETLDNELLWIPKNKAATNQLSSKPRSASNSQEKKPSVSETTKIFTSHQNRNHLKQSDEILSSISQDQEINHEFQLFEPQDANGNNIGLKESSFRKLLQPSHHSNKYIALESSPQRTSKKSRSRSGKQSRKGKCSESSSSRSSSRESAKETVKDSKKKAKSGFSIFGLLKKKNKDKKPEEAKQSKKTSGIKLLQKNSEFLKLDEVEINDLKLESKKTSKVERVSKKSKEDIASEPIPCLMLKNTVPSSKILVYFHANSEDLFLCYDQLDHLKRTLKVDILAPEYPGYGIYKGKASESKIVSDAETIYQYVLTELGYREENVIIFGRSIGSGPALQLASKHKPGSLILMSAFTSVRAVAKARVGILGQYLIKDRFKNLKSIATVESPTLLIHGRKDKTIPMKHSQKLYDACKAAKKIEIRPEMSHNQFDFHDDMSTPIIDFLSQGTNASSEEITLKKESVLIKSSKQQLMMKAI